MRRTSRLCRRIHPAAALRRAVRVGRTAPCALLLLPLLAACSLLPAHEGTVGATPRSMVTGTEVADGSAYGRLPLLFEENRGQTDEQVRFLARAPGYVLFLTDREAVLRLSSPAPASTRERKRPFSARTPRPEAGASVLRLSLAGASPDPGLSAEDLQPSHSNYFSGDDPERWRRDIPHYGRVRYHDVYPGVDLTYYGNPHQLEFDFLVAPGADPAPIRLVFDGADDVKLDDHGDLQIDVGGRRLVQHKPVIYQEIGGRRVGVEGGYRLSSEAGGESPFVASFALGQYDPAHTLVIDPVIVYSTYIAGSGFDFDSVRAIAVDGTGHLYATGITTSLDFPVVGGLDPGSGGQPSPGTFSIFLAKLNPAGNALVYSTYIAGNGDDFGTALKLGADGSAFVTGQTKSSNFPVVGGLPPEQGGTPAGDNSAYVARVNPEGNELLYSTYLSGSGREEAFGLAVDGGGHAYVTGFTESNDFPVVGGLPPEQGGSPPFGTASIFVSKLSAAGDALVYSTYLGGSAIEVGFDIVVDDLGQAYVAADTTSLNLPRIGGLPDKAGGLPSAFGSAYLAKLNTAGDALVYSTYLSGSGSEGGDALAVDATGHVYLAGFTFSSDFPVVGGLPPEQGGALHSDCCVGGFIAKFNPEGNALVYSTYLAGDYIDRPLGLVVDDLGNLYVAGYTSSTNFPQIAGLPADLGGTGPAVPEVGLPTGCGFVSKLHPNGDQLMYSTYLCGNNQIYGLARGPNGDVYVAGVVVPLPDPEEFPIPFPVVGGLPPEQGGTPSEGASGFITKLTEDAPLVSFERARFTIDQAEGQVEVRVIRSGPADGPLAVDFFTEDGTAIAGEDYVATAGTLDWMAGESAPKILSVQILGNPSSGEEEPFFLLRLANGTGAVVGTPDVANITIVGEGVPGAELTFAPASLDFGDVEVGTTSEALFVSLQNTGDLDATGLTFTPTGFGFEADTSACGDTLPAGASCEVSVTFTPTEAGPATASLEVTSDGVTAAAELSGNGVDGGGFTAMALEVDPSSAQLSDRNGVFEPGERVVVTPSWHNDGTLAQSLAGTATDFTGPEGPDYSILVADADYGEIEPGATASCQETGLCYEMEIGPEGAERPAPHWDAQFTETLSDAEETTQPWTLHVGASFTDVPPTDTFYPSIETLLHSGVTGGCGGDEYCPGDANSRAQMPVFMLRALVGPDYAPPECVEGDEVFADVPVASTFCPWIQDLANRGIVAGCGDGNYCPASAVSRAQMAIFLLKTLEGEGYEPPECMSRFTDVPCPSLFADWIEDLAARGITGGCTATTYCPGDPVSRAQMAVFITRAFGFTLYGP